MFYKTAYRHKALYAGKGAEWLLYLCLSCSDSLTLACNASLLLFLPKRDYVTTVVCNVLAPYSGGRNFRQYFFAISYLSHPLTIVQKFTEISQGKPSVWSVKHKRGNKMERCHIRLSHLLVSFLSTVLSKLMSSFLSIPRSILVCLMLSLSAIHCVSKKVPTFKLSVTLSNLNRFSKFLYCWKAYEICYKFHTTLPISP